MGQDPGAIRQDIEQTRERMGETVEALGYKTDVPGRAKEAISDRVGSVKEKVSGVGSTISESTPDGGDVKQGARKAAGIAQENPLGLAIGAVAVGFVGGLLIPSTRVEDEKLGPMADQVKDKARETGQEAVERGKEVAQQAAQSAKETAQEAGREHAEGLRGSAGQKVEETRPGAPTPR
jgi:gas vesicle protein